MGELERERSPRHSRMVRLVVFFPVVHCALLTLVLFGGVSVFAWGEAAMAKQGLPNLSQYTLGIAPAALIVFLILFVVESLLMLLRARRNWS